MSFNDYIHIYNLKNKATSNMKFQQILSSFSLNDERIFLRGGSFRFDIGITILHISKKHIGLHT